MEIELDAEFPYHYTDLQFTNEALYLLEMLTDEINFGNANLLSEYFGIRRIDPGTSFLIEH